MPKSGDGRVEMIRTLRSARRSAVKARVQAANLLQAMLVTAPEELRGRLHALPTKELVAVAARFRPGAEPEDVQAATRFALRSVAQRHEALSEEIAGLDAQLSSGWWRRPPQSCSPCRVSASTTPRRCSSWPGQPREAQQRSLLREPLRGFAHRSVFGQGGQAPSKPGQQPGGQPGAAHDLRGEDELRATHPLLRREAHRRGEEQAGDHEVPQALHRQGGLPYPALLDHRGAIAEPEREGIRESGCRVGFDYKSVTLSGSSHSLVARCIMGSVFSS